MTNYIQKVRRGFTLIELLVGIVIFAIVGALFTKLLTVQGKFFDRQGMGNAARNVSRSSLNRIISDFRMIEATGGVINASPTSLTIRIPYAIGVECADDAEPATHLTLLPVDSTTYANSSFYDYAWRSATTGVYTYVEGGTSVATGNQAVCTGVAVTTVPGGQVVKVKPPLPVGAGLGTPTFLYERVRYEFKNSVAVPGKVGLWRTLTRQSGGDLTEELVAPFANTARWGFYTLQGGNVAQNNPPANLADIRGLELHLDGMSEYVAPGQISNEAAPFTTAVFFKNRTK